MNWKEIMNALYWGEIKGETGEVSESYVKRRIKINRENKEEMSGMTAEAIVDHIHRIGDRERLISRTSSRLSWMVLMGWVRIIGRSREDGRKNVYTLTKSGKKFAEISGATGYD